MGAKCSWKDANASADSGHSGMNSPPASPRFPPLALHCLPRPLHFHPAGLHSLPGPLHLLPTTLHSPPSQLHFPPSPLQSQPPPLHCLPGQLHTPPTELHCLPGPLHSHPRVPQVECSTLVFGVGRMQNEISGSRKRLRVHRSHSHGTESRAPLCTPSCGVENRGGKFTTRTGTSIDSGSVTCDMKLLFPRVTSLFPRAAVRGPA